MKFVKCLALFFVLTFALNASDLIHKQTSKKQINIKKELNVGIVQTMDAKISRIYKMLEDAKNAKLEEDLNNNQIDVTQLPVVKGIYSIKKTNGKVLKKEFYAQDAGGTNNYYLNKHNNIFVNKINKDFVVYKVGRTYTKTAIAYDSATATKIAKTEQAKINRFSSVKTKRKNAISTPSLDQVIQNLQRTAPKK